MNIKQLFTNKKIRLGIEFFLFALTIILGILLYFSYRKINTTATSIKSISEKNERIAVTKALDSAGKRSAQEAKILEKNIRYSLTKEIFSPNIQFTYELPSEAIDFSASQRKQYAVRKYVCSNSKTENQQNNEFLKNNFSISGSILLWCSSGNDVFAVVHVDQSNLIGFFISMNDQPKINYQTEMMSTNNDSSNFSINLVLWKHAPETNEQWFTYEVDESIEAKNLQWDKDRIEKYYYQWQTSSNPVLQEFCVESKNNTHSGIDTKCSHVESSTSPKYIR